MCSIGHSTTDMKHNKNFDPSSTLELVQDYAYILLDEESQTAQRKYLKYVLIELMVPRIHIEHLDALTFESKLYNKRSIMLVNSASATYSYPALNNLDTRLFNDDEALSVIKRVVERSSKTLERLKVHEPGISQIYLNRTSLTAAASAARFYRTALLENYMELSVHSDYYYSSAHAVVHHRLLANAQSTQQKLVQQQDQLAPQFGAAIQPFSRYFAQKNLESLEAKQLAVKQPVHVVTGESLTFSPVQPVVDQCDDPTRPQHYVNDPRLSNSIKLEQQPYGRLLIRGNPNGCCIYYDKQLVEAADDLAAKYVLFEKSLAASTVVMAAYLHKQITDAEQINTLIKGETERVVAGGRAQITGFDNDSQQSAEEEALANCYKLQNCYWEGVENQDLSQQIQNCKNSHTTNAIIDFDELIILNERSTMLRSYFVEPPFPHIKIKIGIKTIFVPYPSRNSTTYEALCAFTKMLSFRHAIPKFLQHREYTHQLAFDTDQALRSLFVPLTLMNSQLSHAELQKAVLSKTYREKSYGTRLLEDAGAGDCGVCGCRYDNYKSHINAADHIRALRGLMQSEGGMVGELIIKQKLFERYQAVLAQFYAQAFDIAALTAQPWEDVAAAMNEAIRASGEQFCLDQADVPRAASPTVHGKEFNIWQDAVMKSRLTQLEVSMSLYYARRSAYQRVRAQAGGLALLVRMLENKELYQLQNGAQFGEQPTKTPSDNILEVRLHEHQFGFPEDGYDSLIQIAFVTVLTRLAQGLTAFAEADHYDYTFYEEQTVEAAEDVGRELGLSNPELSGDIYLKELKRLRTERQYEEVKMHQRRHVQPGPGQIRLDAKKLKAELGRIEIGLIPRTDELVRLATTVLYMTGRSSDIVDTAFVWFEQDTTILTEKAVEQLRGFIDGGYLVTKFDEPLIRLQTRLKLPDLKPVCLYKEITADVAKTKDIQLYQNGDAASIYMMYYIQSSDKQTLKSLLQKSATLLYIYTPQYLGLPLDDNLTIMPEVQVEEVVYDDERSCSAAKRSTSPRIIRPNSVYYGAQLDKDQLSLVLLGRQQFGGFSRSFNTVSYLSESKSFNSALKRQQQLAEAGEEHQTVALVAPLVTKKSQNQKPQNELFPELFPPTIVLKPSQIAACHSLVLCARPLVQAEQQLHPAVSTALMGAAGSLNTLLGYNTFALKTADPVSAVAVALRTRLTQGQGWGSKTVRRCLGYEEVEIEDGEWADADVATQVYGTNERE